MGTAAAIYTQEKAPTALDKIDKEGLLRLVDWTLRETTVVGS